MRTDHALVAGLAFALTALATARADAFCRTTTVPIAADFDPRMNGCFTEGKPLYLPSQCFPYRLQAKESATIPNAVLSDRLARAFVAWTATNPTCTPGIAPLELASVSTKPAIYDHQNVVTVEAEWPYAGGTGDSNLALSTLKFNVDTGEILDVDVEINGTADWSFEDSPASNKVDLQSVLTHEVGHIFGIAHTDVEGSAMNPTYQPGSIGPRTLSTDDQAAICAVYPNRGERLSPTGLVPSTPCDLTPGSACADPQILHGCATAVTPVRFGSGASVLLGLAVLATGRRISGRRSADRHAGRRSRGGSHA